MGTECLDKEGEGTRMTRVSVLAEADDDLPVCWICLGHSEPDRPLTHPCRCPSWCHATCVARWQLQSAGTRREKFCDFCSCELPDWKSVLTPTPAPTAPAVMNVNFDNKTYSFQVAPGADGYRQFTEAIRKAFHLPEDSELNITFTCDEPSSGSLLTLSGPGAYDAAVHCASVSAARRSMSADGERAHREHLEQHGTMLFDGTGSRILNAAEQQQCPLLQEGGADVQETAVAAGSPHHGLQDNSAADAAGSSSSSSGRMSHDGGSLLDGLSRRTSSSSSRDSLAAAEELPSPASGRRGGSSSSSADHRADLQSTSQSSSSGASTSSRASDAGSDSSIGERSARWSNASTSSAASSSSSSSNSSNSHGSSGSRRSQGFGRKLREAIADMLISK